MCYRTYSYISDLILVLRSIYWSYGSYTCVTKLILGFRILYLYYGVDPCTSDLIRSLFLYKSTCRYYTDSLYGGTHRYYWTYTYITDTGVPVDTTELILILLIREYSYVLQSLYLFYRYGSTRRYYRTYTYFTDTGVLVGTTELIGTTRLILILLIREYPWVLHNLIRYRSTHRYYRT